MDFERYQEQVKRTASGEVSGIYAGIYALATWALVLAGKGGEMADTLMMSASRNYRPDQMDMAKELGDMLYYLAMLANECGLSLEAIAQGNIKKLAMRYPDVFDSGRSQNRAASDS